MRTTRTLSILLLILSVFLLSACKSNDPAKVYPEMIRVYSESKGRELAYDCSVKISDGSRTAEYTLNGEVLVRQEEDEVSMAQRGDIRVSLDGGSMACVVKEDAVGEMLASLKEKPKMVITDSQAFGVVSKAVPDDIPLTSFSILMARRKGYLESSVKAVSALRTLRDGDTVLISEGCTHHRQCGDIGTVKIPAWIKAYTGKDIKFEVTSGADFPDDLSKYKLIFHCGGCMLNEREMKYRKKHAEDCGVPMTNYGVAIAAFNGILSRSLSLFPDLQKLVD